MDNDCCICYRECHEVLQPCGHSLCIECAKRWFVKSPSCPMCRSPVVHLNGLLQETTTHNLVVIVFPSRNMHVGITLSSCNGKLHVDRVKKKDLGFKCGLRRGNLITHINGIAIHDHSVAVQMIEAAKARAIPLYCSVAKPSRMEKLFAFCLF